MSSNSKQCLMALLTAIIWGSAFVAQTVSADIMEPFFFMFARGLLSCAFLAFLALTARSERKYSKEYTRKLITGGGLSGIALFLASYLQQAGIGIIDENASGKAGFLTALYIVLVPILRLVSGKKAQLRVWISVVVAIAGFWLLCVKDGLAIGKGELMVLGCALIFAIQIIVIDRFGNELDSVQMSLVQFIVVTALSGACTLLFENTPISAAGEGIIPILYSGILSGGVGYTLQIAAQKDVADPTEISLILSLESVFSAVAGVIILQEMLSVKEWLGCVLIFAAAVTAQLSGKSIKNKDVCSKS